MTRLERKLQRRVRKLEAALAAALYERDRRYQHDYSRLARARQTLGAPIKPTWWRRLLLRVL